MQSEIENEFEVTNLPSTGTPLSHSTHAANSETLNSMLTELMNYMLRIRRKYTYFLIKDTQFLYHIYSYSHLKKILNRCFFAVHWCNETITNIITIIKSWQRQKWFSELYSTHDDMQILIVRLSQQKLVLNIVNNIKIRIFSSTLCNGKPQNKLVKNIPYKT